MTTYRVVKRSDPYTRIDRHPINDDGLSFRARGVLVWLLDKPDDWSCSAESLAKAGTEGRDALRTALKELADRRYLVRRREQGDGGRWVTVTEVHERPIGQGSVLATDDGLPGIGEPATDDGLPVVGLPGLKTQGLKQKEGEATPLPDDAAKAEADRLAKAEWERRKAAGVAMPIGGFPAFRMRIRECIDAGHSPDAIAKALTGMTTFTRGSFEFALSGRGDTRPKPRQHQAIDTDRTGPSGEIDMWGDQ